MFVCVLRVMVSGRGGVSKLPGLLIAELARVGLAELDAEAVADALGKSRIGRASKYFYVRHSGIQIYHVIVLFRRRFHDLFCVCVCVCVRQC